MIVVTIYGEKFNPVLTCVNFFYCLETGFAHKKTVQLWLNGT